MNHRSSRTSDSSEPKLDLKKSSSKSKEETNTSQVPKTQKYTLNQSNNLKSTSTMTLTYGDVAENHQGMQKIGNLAESGFSVSELQEAQKKFEAKGCKCEYLDINTALEGTDVTGEPAAILIVRNGINFLNKDLTADKLFHEQINLEWDKKAFMKGRVVNKHARHNLCYSDRTQDPDYETGKGRIVDFKDLPQTALVRKSLQEFLGDKAKNLQAEGNLYFDLAECGIGFHGDTERRIVIALRLGARMNLQYQWFIRGGPVGKRVELWLEHGDLYVMSEKASGFDWKKKIKATLRHAAGSKKFTTIKQESKKEVNSKKGDDEKGKGKKKKEEKKETKKKGKKKESSDESEEESDEESEEEKVNILSNSKKITKVKY